MIKYFNCCRKYYLKHLSSRYIIIAKIKASYYSKTLTKQNTIMMLKHILNQQVS